MRKDKLVSASTVYWKHFKLTMLLWEMCWEQAGDRHTQFSSSAASHMWGLLLTAYLQSSQYHWKGFVCVNSKFEFELNLDFFIVYISWDGFAFQGNTLHSKGGALQIFWEFYFEQCCSYFRSVQYIVIGPTFPFI